MSSSSVRAANGEVELVGERCVRTPTLVIHGMADPLIQPQGALSTRPCGARVPAGPPTPAWAMSCRAPSDRRSPRTSRDWSGERHEQA
jgi:hypothetical protein